MRTSQVAELVAVLLFHLPLVAALAVGAGLLRGRARAALGAAAVAALLGGVVQRLAILFVPSLYPAWLARLTARPATVLPARLLAITFESWWLPVVVVCCVVAAVVARRDALSNVVSAPHGAGAHAVPRGVPGWPAAAARFVGPTGSGRVRAPGGGQSMSTPAVPARAVVTPLGGDAPTATPPAPAQLAVSPAWGGQPSSALPAADRPGASAWGSPATTGQPPTAPQPVATHQGGSAPSVGPSSPAGGPRRWVRVWRPLTPPPSEPPPDAKPVLPS